MEYLFTLLMDCILGFDTSSGNQHCFHSTINLPLQTSADTVANRVTPSASDYTIWVKTPPIGLVHILDLLLSIYTFYPCFNM